MNEPEIKLTVANPCPTIILILVPAFRGETNRYLIARFKANKSRANLNDCNRNDSDRKMKTL